MAKGIKTGGRKAGTPNKLSTTVKQNVIDVFGQIGGPEEMAEWARSHRGEFYRLYCRLLPHELDANLNNTFDADHMTDGEFKLYMLNEIREHGVPDRKTLEWLKLIFDAGEVATLGGGEAH
jgi:hypothetical protein